jgi:hypothetical protein
MARIFKRALTAGLMALSCQLAQAETFFYNLAGTVGESDGSWADVVVGAPVTGSFSLDFSPMSETVAPGEVALQAISMNEFSLDVGGHLLSGHPVVLHAFYVETIESRLLGLFGFEAGPFTFGGASQANQIGEPMALLLYVNSYSAPHLEHRFADWYVGGYLKPVGADRMKSSLSFVLHATPAVPEIGSASMLLLGFASLAGLVRVRRRRVATALIEP